MKKFVLILLSVLIINFTILNADVNFKGLVQTWFSFAGQNIDDSTGYGFTLRRLRFAPYGSFGKNIKWGFQVGWDKQQTQLYDAYIDFTLSKQLSVKIGQFAAPGTVSGALTSSGKLDLIERAMVIQKWNGNSGLYGYRAFGIQFHGKLMNDKLYYAFMISNPTTLGIFTPGVKSSTYTHENNGMSFWGRLEVMPIKGLNFGGFFGTSKTTDTEYKRNSFGAHVFYVKNNFNFKVEYLSGQFGLDELETKYSGFFVLVGYKINNKVEPIFRYDTYSPNGGDADGLGVETYNNIGIGVNYYYCKKIKFQVNYIIRTETMTEGLDDLKNNIFYVNFQYSFN